MLKHLIQWFFQILDWASQSASTSGQYQRSGNPPIRADKFQFQAVSTHEIRRTIMYLSSNMAPCHDEKTMSAIKDALPYILAVLKDIVNRSLLSSVFPSYWKFLKPPRYSRKEIMRLQTITAQYRFSRWHRRFASEWPWINWLRTWATKRGWPNSRRGNKKLHSCETLNVVMTNKALEAMDAKKLTPVVLLDLSKVLDSLDHHRLTAKFKTLGVGRTALE